MPPTLHVPLFMYYFYTIVCNVYCICVCTYIACTHIHTVHAPLSAGVRPLQVIRQQYQHIHSNPAPNFLGHKLCSNNKAITAATGNAHIETDGGAVAMRGENGWRSCWCLCGRACATRAISVLFYISTVLQFSIASWHGLPAVSGSNKHLHNVIIFTSHHNITTSSIHQPNARRTHRISVLSFSISLPLSLSTSSTATESQYIRHATIDNRSPDFYRPYDCVARVCRVEMKEENWSKSGTMFCSYYIFFSPYSHPSKNERVQPRLLDLYSIELTTTNYL